MMNPMVANFRNMMAMLNGSHNPQQTIMQMASQNPQMNQIIQMCNGKNPKDVFFSECQRRGIDPNQFLSQLGVNKP